MMELIIGLLLGVIGGVTANTLYEYLSTKMSWISSGYPDIRGKWLGVYNDSEGKTIHEEIEVNNQFLNRISGTFASSKEASLTSTRYKYDFTGKYLDKSYVSVSFKSQDRFFTDYGVAIYKVDTAHRSFKGSSVSLSLEDGEIFSHPFSGQKTENG